MSNLPVNGRKFEDNALAYFSMEHFQGGHNNSKINSAGASNAIQAQGGIPQAIVRCPHGAPGGACPICAGKAGGGGGGSADTLKKTGMSWNEAYLVWSGIQLAKLGAKESIERNQAEALKSQDILIKLLNDIGFADKIRFAQNIIHQSVINIVQGFAQVGNSAINAVKPLVVAINTVINNLKDTLTNLQGVVEKLAAIIGEEIKNLREKFIQNFEKIMQKLFDKENLSRLIKVLNEKKKEFYEFLTKSMKSLKEKISEFFTFIMSIGEKNRNKTGKKSE